MITVPSVDGERSFSKEFSLALFIDGQQLERGIKTLL